LRKLTEGDPERLKRAQEFHENIDEVFSFRGTRRAVEDVRGGDENVITIAHAQSGILMSASLHTRSLQP
jgi:hypothetical protein